VSPEVAGAYTPSGASRAPPDTAPARPDRLRPRSSPRRGRSAGGIADNCVQLPRHCPRCSGRLDVIVVDLPCESADATLEDFPGGVTPRHLHRDDIRVPAEVQRVMAASVGAAVVEILRTTGSSTSSPRVPQICWSPPPADRELVASRPLRVDRGCSPAPGSVSTRRRRAPGGGPVSRSHPPRPSRSRCRRCSSCRRRRTGQPRPRRGTGSCAPPGRKRRSSRRG
jgi:hypothetical protein